MRMLELQVAEIDCEPHAFTGIEGANALINGSLRSEANGVVAKDAEHGGPEKNLMGLCLWNRDVVLEKAIGMFAYEFCKKAPVPMIRGAAPFRWTVAVDEAVIENIGALCSGMFGKFCECTAQPNVMAARSKAGNDTKHEAGRIGRNDVVDGGLCARNDEAREHSGLDARANFRRAVLEAPLRGDVEVAAGLDPCWRKQLIAENGGSGNKQCEMRREAVTDETAHRGLLAKIVGAAEDSGVKAPFARGICRRREAKDGSMAVGKGEGRKTKTTKQQKPMLHDFLQAARAHKDAHAREFTGAGQRESDS